MNFDNEKISSFRIKSSRRSKVLWSLLPISFLGVSGCLIYFLTLPPKEKRVYLSSLDSYYYYELTPRALSLGLNTDSETYVESVAIQSGYTAVPKELEDTDALEEKTERFSREVDLLIAEREQLKESQAQQLALLEEAELSRLLDVGREVFITAIRSAVDLDLNTTFGNWQILKLDNNTYRIDVQVDQFGNGIQVRDYSMTGILLANDRFYVVDVDVSDSYQTRKKHMNISDWSKQEKNTYIRKY